MAIHKQAKKPGTPTWLDLMAHDPEAARKFYHAVFGWTYNVGGPEFGGYTVAQKNGHDVAGIAAPMPGQPMLPQVWTLYFASNDLAGDTDHAAKLGATVLSPAMDIGEFGGMSMLSDPTGAPFALWRSGHHIGSRITEEHGAPAWCELYTNDAAKARDFYCALLNATADPMPGGMEYYVLKHGEAMLAGIMQVGTSGDASAPAWINYFSVESADATAATVVSHGGKQMGSIDDSEFGRMAALSDPFGAQFKVIESPKR